jgi:hypothetical protein
LAEIVANIDAETTGITSAEASGVDVSLVKHKGIVVRIKQISHLSSNDQLLVKELSIDAQI